MNFSTHNFLNYPIIPSYLIHIIVIIPNEHFKQMSRSSAQKSAIASISKQKKPEEPPVFDPKNYVTKNANVDDVVKLK